MRRYAWIAGVLGVTLVAGTAAANGGVTVFDQLNRIDSAAAADRTHAAAMQQRVMDADSELDKRWASVEWRRVRRRQSATT